MALDDLVLNRMITQFDIIMDVDMAQPSVRYIPTPHPTPPPLASLDNIIRFADVYYSTTYATLPPILGTTNFAAGF